MHVPWSKGLFWGRVLPITTNNPTCVVNLARLCELTQEGMPSSTVAELNQWMLGDIGFSNVTVSKNGFVLLGTPGTMPTPDTPLTNAPTGILAPFMRQLELKPQSRVYAAWFNQVEPMAAISWHHMGLADDPDVDLTFELQITVRTRQVRFAYAEMKDGTNTYAGGQTGRIGAHLGGDGVYEYTDGIPESTGLGIVLKSEAAATVKWTDNDNDFLVDKEEPALGLNPNNADTDGDGMGDGWEYTHRGFVNPREPDADGDPDQDGYRNIIEYFLGSDPRSAASPGEIGDADKDGMPDTWETAHGLNPADPCDALQDPDADGYCNVLERAIGGDPQDPANHGRHPCEPNGGVSTAVYE